MSFPKVTYISNIIRDNEVISLVEYLDICIGIITPQHPVHNTELLWEI